MITKFKMYESVNILPKVGDYVIIDIEEFSHSRKLFIDLISTNIGKIVDTKIEHGGTQLYYIVNFGDGIASEFKDYEFDNYGNKTFRITSFKYWAEYKDELEAIINSKKYNL